MSKRRPRQSYSDDFKKQVVSETFEPGVSVSRVARRHDINANLVFRWRDDPRFANGTDDFLPIEIEAGPTSDTAQDHAPSELAIWIAGDVRLAVKGDYDPVVLGNLIRNVRMPA